MAKKQDKVIGMSALEREVAELRLWKTASLMAEQQLQEQLKRTEYELNQKHHAVGRAEAVIIQLKSELNAPRALDRKRLPDERKSLTHRFEIRTSKDVDGQIDPVPITIKAYLTMGFYDDGQLGEIFFKIAKSGSEISGPCDAWAISASMLLQYGVPFKVIADKHRGARFEPSGFTSNTKLRSATSPIDYVVRYIEQYLADRAEGR